MSNLFKVLIFLSLGLVYFLGLFIVIMDVDSAQYANISLQMAKSDEFLQVKARGIDYLDKPPLLFWINALFFKLLGVSNWSFKIGSFLFSILGVYSTYKLGSILYSKKVGFWAGLILASSQAFILINNDVRTDTMLASAVVFSIWMIMAWLKKNSFIYLIGASVGIALAMLAKGPIGLMVPVLALSSYFIGKGEFRNFLKWEYLLVLAMVFILISPMLYGLYEQFDKHPEKEVSMITPKGMKIQTGVSGLKFYFWTQSFGRITGENVWKNDSGIFFFIHNFFWSFLPWSLLFVGALFGRLKSIFQSYYKGTPLPEFLTPLGFLLPFIILSFSSYKLPHYVFIIYPLAAILLADWLVRLKEINWVKRYKALMIAQSFVLVLSIFVSGLVYFIFFPSSPYYLVGISILFFTIATYCLWKYKENAIGIVLASVFVSVGTNVSLNGRFYPELMKYQAGSSLAQEIHNLDIDPSEIHSIGAFSFSLEYYLGGLVETSSIGLLDQKLALDSNAELYVVSSHASYLALKKRFKVEELASVESHPVTRLNMSFLNPETRPQSLDDYHLLKISSL